MNFYYDKKLFWRMFTAILLLVIPMVIALYLAMDFEILQFVIFLLYCVLGSAAITFYIDKEYYAKSLSAHKDFEIIHTSGNAHLFLLPAIGFFYLISWAFFMFDGTGNIFGSLMLFPLIYCIHVERRVIISGGKIHYLGKQIPIDENLKVQSLDKKIKLESSEHTTTIDTNKEAAKIIVNKILKYQSTTKPTT